MAGDWIKMRADLFTHPKVFAIASKLDKDELFVVGALLAFWGWAHAHAVDGRVDGATSHLVDKVTRVNGLAGALIDVGWLEVDAVGVSIPRFEVHNSDSAKERALKNERQSRWREKKRAEDVDAKPSTGASTRPSTREEKRRVIPPIPLSGGFEVFWSAWPKGPRKQSQGKCAEVWARRGLDALSEKIMAHVEAMKQTDGWKGGFVPAPLVYLNQARWEGAEIVPVSQERRVAL